ncbi:hypothetical protein J4H86_05455 [Spiractinospora alimapuensis]|uniref:hypothetical protein n=1 Tax=Spiractinospora alimapuensis TaxID=2820884 RepID=UPI001F25CE88|nr:hypothetical protein [Spiractinospora alimapuensis]QVQ55193.1 hypothetical protein J4H86_05455 [Spiractinospora alimapuensis]
MTEPNRDRENGTTNDIIDDALRMVESLQRKLLVAGVRRGVSAATAAPSKGDVWEEAVSDAPDHRSSCEYCPICKAMDAMRASGVDVSGSMDRVATTLRAAADELWATYERSRPAPDEKQDSDRS